MADIKNYFAEFKMDYDTLYQQFGTMLSTLSKFSSDLESISNSNSKITNNIAVSSEWSDSVQVAVCGRMNKVTKRVDEVKTAINNNTIKLIEEIRDTYFASMHYIKEGQETYAELAAKEALAKSAYDTATNNYNNSFGGTKSGILGGFFKQPDDGLLNKKTDANKSWNVALRALNDVESKLIKLCEKAKAQKKTIQEKDRRFSLEKTVPTSTGNSGTVRSTLNTGKTSNNSTTQDNKAYWKGQGYSSKVVNRIAELGYSEKLDYELNDIDSGFKSTDIIYMVALSKDPSVIKEQLKTRSISDIRDEWSLELDNNGIEITSFY